MSETTTHSGSCLCNAVHFEISGEIKNIAHCHCIMCQKAHGAAFGTYAATPKESFDLHGQEHITEYESSPGITRTFCKHCGSNIQWIGSSPRSVEWASFALALLDDDFQAEKQKHIFTDNKVDWIDLCDQHPKFKEEH